MPRPASLAPDRKAPIRERARRHSAATRWLSIGLALLCAACGNEAAPPARPNVVLYVVDTLRADALEPYGNPVVATPNARQLAREGVLFARSYAQSTWTRPSIASLLTGEPPEVHGTEARHHDLPAALVLLPERFRAAGYATACVTTNPNIGSFFGFDRGYDRYIELYARRQRGVVGADEAKTRSGVAHQRALEWIDAQQQPFFLFVLTADPHQPYDPPPGFDRYMPHYTGGVRPGGHYEDEDFDEADRQRIRSLYHAEVSAADHALGEFLDALRERGIYDDLVLAYTADHGEAFWEHGYLGHGKNVYEPTLRVPLILRAPGRLPAGRVVEQPVTSLDVAPTLLALAGIAAPEALPGRVIGLDAPGAGRPIHATLHITPRRHVSTLIDYPWKLVLSRAPDPDAARRRAGIATGLFQLADDPNESVDLAASEPARFAAMKRTLEASLRADRERGAAARSGQPGPDRPIPAELRSALEALGYVGRDPTDAGD